MVSKQPIIGVIICSDARPDQLCARTVCDVQQRNTALSSQLSRAPLWSVRLTVCLPHRQAALHSCCKCLIRWLLLQLHHCGPCGDDPVCGCGSERSDWLMLCTCTWRRTAFFFFFFTRPTDARSFKSPFKWERANDELFSPQKRIDYFSAEIIGAQPQVCALGSWSTRSPESPVSPSSCRRSWRQRWCRMDRGLWAECAETSLPTKTRRPSKFRRSSPRAEKLFSPANQYAGWWLCTGGRETQDEQASERQKQVLQVQTLTSAPRLLQRWAAYCRASPGCIQTGQDDFSNSVLPKTSRRHWFLFRAQGESHDRVILKSQLWPTCDQLSCAACIQPHIQKTERDFVRVWLQSPSYCQVSLWPGKTPCRGH